MPRTEQSRFRRALPLIIAFVVAFDIAFIAQKFGGCYDSEFGAHPDEAAHCVTGIFVRDGIVRAASHIRDGIEQPAMAEGKKYADTFYEHYPKVALGVWPPAFYLVQSAWTLPFGTSRMALLLCMAALAGGVATLIFRAARTEFGTFAAATAAILWLFAPHVRTQYGMVMAETLSTLTMLGAVLSWGRYLDTRRTADAVWFGLIASAAILTKASALALALMCGLSIVLSCKWSALRYRGTWFAALLVAALAGPWTWYFRSYGVQVGGWADNSGGISLAFVEKAAPFYLLEILFVCGIAVSSFAAVGAVVRLRGERAGRWAALTAFVIAVFAFQSAVPVGIERRHILPVAPALLLLALAGMQAIARLPLLRAAGAEQARREALWSVLLAILSLPFFVMQWEKKGCSGFLPLALEVLEKAQPLERILISSDASGEGMFIAEIAMRDARPNLIIERASKSLVESKGRTWDGRNQRNRYRDDDELHAYITSGRFAYIVLDDAVPEKKRSPYHDQLRRVIEEHTGSFWQMEESRIFRDNEPTHRPARLYRVTARNRILPAL